MSNLSELLPTGGGQNAVDFVASGTLSSGQTVALKADGTVTAISASGNPQELGTPALFANASSSWTDTVYDSANNKIIIAFMDGDNADRGTAIVGTVSGTTISFGTEVVFDSSAVRNVAMAYDSSNQKVVIFYRDGGNSYYGTGIVGTVSGTSISFGTPTVFATVTGTDYFSATFDSGNSKAVVTWADNNFTKGRVVACTVSGTSLSFDTSSTYSDTVSYTDITYDSSSGYCFVVFRDHTNSYYGTALLVDCSTSTTSIASAEYVYNSAASNFNTVSYDTSANKFAIAYADGGNSDSGTGIVATVSGTTISFGSEVVFNSGETNNIISCFDSDNNKIVFSYRDSTNLNYATIIVGTISGTSISFGSEVVYQTNTTTYQSCVFDPVSGGAVIAYSNDGNLNKGTYVVFKNPSSNSADFIGITAEAISDTATGAVNVYGGINEAQTGLTIGSDYYVQTDGSLSTTASAVKVGQAISATTINMMDLT